MGQAFLLCVRCHALKRIAVVPGSALLADGAPLDLRFLRFRPSCHQFLMHPSARSRIFCKSGAYLLARRTWHPEPGGTQAAPLSLKLSARPHEPHPSDRCRLGVLTLPRLPSRQQIVRNGRREAKRRSLIGDFRTSPPSPAPNVFPRSHALVTALHASYLPLAHL